MIVFTSGTTSKPKGAVITHKAIHAQVTTLIEAWRWTRNDSVPLFLPLHHLHGIINVLSCALWCGATVHAVPKLDVARLCEQAGSGAFSVFMAVPTVYVKLIEHIESLAPPQRKAVCEGFREMRLECFGIGRLSGSRFRAMEEADRPKRFWSGTAPRKSAWRSPIRMTANGAPGSSVGRCRG